MFTTHSKRILSLAIALVLVLTIAPIAPYAGAVDEFEITDGVLVKYNGDNKEAVIIPAGVTSIGDNAFENHDEIYSIDFPAGLKSIGDYAFAMCQRLVVVNIPDGVTIIGEHAFENCSWELKNVTIPASVETIGDWAFSACYHLEELKIAPGGSMTIGRRAFDSCWNLKEVVIPDGVTVVDNEAFYNCLGLSSVTIAPSVVGFGWYPFGYIMYDWVDYIKITDVDYANLSEADKKWYAADFTIYGEAGSEAEQYAKSNDFKFVASGAPVTSAPTPTPAAPLTATPTSAKVQVNGKTTDFDAYTINSQTYYQIADIARTIVGTPKQFSAAWDSALGAINLTSGSAQDGTLSPKGTAAKTPTDTKAKIYLDGKEVPLKAYTIDGHTYYQMKAVAELFNFGVGFANGTITVDTSADFAL
jgi:hypothetical protein